MEISDRLATAALPLILAGIDELLLHRGFQRRAHDERLDERRYFGWHREHGVIGNLIDASYPERAPHNLDLGIEVYLRRSPQPDLRRLRAIIVEETGRALAWFDRYATPALCLERLASPERNGVRVGTAQWTEAKALLEALVAKGSS